VIAELISDLYPTSDIFPTDAVERAKVRFFVDFATKKLIPAVGGMIHGGALHQAVLEHVERTQTLLDPKLKFFLGDRITQADAALAPFLCYLYALVRSLVPAKEDGETAKFLSALKQDKYSTFFKYMETVVTHPTVKETFNEV
jgi:glutathione S-transferase